MSQRDELERRKALIIARADLHRLRLSLSVHEMRGIIAPAARADQKAWARPRAMRVLRIALPLLGVTKSRGIVRGLGLGLAVIRAVRGWRD